MTTIGLVGRYTIVAVLLVLNISLTFASTCQDQDNVTCNFKSSVEAAEKKDLRVAAINKMIIITIVHINESGWIF